MKRISEASVKQSTRKPTRTILAAAVAAVAATSFVPATAWSQAMLEEIVVTARKQAESMMDVPVAVSAIGAEQMARLGITDMRDLAAFSPGMLMERGGSGAGGTIAIRGISTSSTQAGFEQAVSVAIDGVQTGRPRALGLGLMDVRQVEVLRGPQALFFGKNSPGGVLSISSADPTDEFEAMLRGSYEFEAEEYKVDGFVSGALSDTWGARFAFSTRDMDGWIENTAPDWTGSGGSNPFPFVEWDQGVPQSNPQDFGESEDQMRLTLQYDSGDRFRANLKAGYSQMEAPGGAAGRGCYVGVGPNKNLFNYRNDGAGINQLEPVYNDANAECDIDEKFSQGGITKAVQDSLPDGKKDPYTDVDITLLSATLDYEWDNWTLTSVTGYFESNMEGHDRYGNTAYAQIPVTESEDYESFSQELRFASSYDGAFNYLFGFFYEDSDQEFINNAKIAAIGPDPRSGALHSWEKLGKTDGETMSVFGQVLWDISEQWELSAGARYTEEEKDSTLENTYIHAIVEAGFGGAPVGKVFTNDFDDDNLSPEVTLTWRPNDFTTAYVGYRTGWKSGGFGLSETLLGYFSGVTDEEQYVEDIAFDSETIEGFEAGVKTELLDGSMILQGSVYTYEYDDLQVSAFDARTVSYTINNAASADVYGAEVEMNYLISDQFRLFGALNYNIAEYNDYITACYNSGFPNGQTPEQGCNVPNGDGTFSQNMNGNPLALAPEWTANLGFDWYIGITEGLDLNVTANARYSDEYQASNNGNPDGMVDSYTVFDAALRLMPDNGNWEVALIGRNLTEEYYTVRANEKPGGIGELTAGANRGRQYALEALYRF